MNGSRRATGHLNDENSTRPPLSPKPKHGRKIVENIRRNQAKQQQQQQQQQQQCDLSCLQNKTADKAPRPDRKIYAERPESRPKSLAVGKLIFLKRFVIIFEGHLREGFSASWYMGIGTPRCLI